MTTTTAAAQAAHPHDFHAAGFPPGAEGRALFWIAVAFSVFQIATAAHLVDFASQITRAAHVGFLMLLGFPFLALAAGRGVGMRALGWAAGGAALGRFLGTPARIRTFNRAMAAMIALGVVGMILG